MTRQSFVFCFFVIMFFSMKSFADTPAFTITDKEIAKICGDAIATAGKALDEIAANKREPSFKNTVLAMEDALSDFDITVEVPVFLQSVSPNALIRQAGTDCEIASKKFAIDTFSRDDLFVKVQTLRSSKDGKKLEREDQKLLEDYYASFLQNGLGTTDPERRKVIKNLSKQISELESEFSKNIRDDKRFIQVDRSELAGTPEDWISKLAKAPNGKFIVTTDYPDFYPFMENAKSDNARKRLYEQFSIRGGKKNVEILEKTLHLRNDFAIAMGYNNYADKVFMLDGRMAKSTGQVRDFLSNLTDQLEPYLVKDLNEMRRLKCREIKCPDWDKISIQPWDINYYINKMQKKDNVDPEVVKEYFPFDKVISGMFQIYQNLLSLDFEKQQDQNVWDPSVEVYTVKDRVTHEVLGSFYLDLFPRDGKYNHAAVWGLIKPKYLGRDKYLKTVAAMVCNFPKPTADQPSLLHHKEVKTFFHEFGHVMDAIVSRTKYYSHGGSSIYNERMTGTPRDFVEAPSQMLENWVWNPESLAMLSGHYKTGDKLPKDLLDRMISIKNVANGYINMRQLFFATVDLDFHTSPPVDSTAAWGEKMKTMLHIEPLKGVYPQASFGHIMGGYDAGYYGYMWSKVFAEDMYSEFEKAGILNPRTGMMYRKFVLEPSGSQPVANSIKNFIKRDPNPNAFLKSLGIEAEKTKPAL